MFFGKEPVSIMFLVEIMLRTAIMYFYTLVNIRLFRARTITQLTSFELIIVIAFGTAMGDPMFYTDVPLINGMVCVTVMVLLTKFAAILTARYDTMERLIEGVSIMVIKNGEIIKAGMSQANLSEEELFERLRLHGIKNVGQIEYAFLEASGQLSIITSKEPKNGTSTLNHLT